MISKLQSLAKLLVLKLMTNCLNHHRLTENSIDSCININLQTNAYSEKFMVEFRYHLMISPHASMTKNTKE